MLWEGEGRADLSCVLLDKGGTRVAEEAKEVEESDEAEETDEGQEAEETEEAEEADEAQETHEREEVGRNCGCGCVTTRRLWSGASVDEERLIGYCRTR